MKKLNTLLGLSQADEVDADDLKVDVTLRTIGQAPMIMLLFTVDRPSSAESKSEDVALTKASISFEIGINGRISVVEVTGLLGDENNILDDVNADGQTTAESTNELRSKLAYVLEISQDIGVLVEWVLRWVRQQKSRG
jgi:hypothetical protein